MVSFAKKTGIDPTRVIFDLETLDTQPTGVIVSMGVIPFQLQEKNTFEELVAKGINMLFERQPQIDAGCSISQATLDWWVKQGKEARECLEGGDRIHPKDMHTVMKAAFSIPPKTKWYCRGQHFDFPMVINLCHLLGIREPWGYQDPRDLRTWFDFYKGYERDLWRDKQEGFIAHNSLHDSALEALHMQQCFQLKEGE